MDAIIINGGHALHGNVATSGAKNAALPLLFSTLLAEGWLERTIPDKPRSKNQRYRISEAGRMRLELICESVIDAWATAFEDGDRGASSGQGARGLQPQQSATDANATAFAGGAFE